MMKPFAVLGAAAVVALALAWFTGNLASGTSADRMILRMGLALIVLIAAAVVAWFLLQSKKAAAPASSPKSSTGDQLDLILREAETKLASAQRGPGTRIANLPVYLVIGPAGASKTTIVAQSGVEAELLAGEVYTDGVITPTPYSNFWYGKLSVFVEAGEKLLNDSSAWLRLVKKLVPGKLKSVLNQGGQAPRAAIVCFDAETLLRQPLETSLAASRNLRTRLSEFASTLGISIPVYVLFTKADRLPFFPEFVANLDSAEASQIFGATFPLAAPSSGTYGEEQTGKVNEAYRQLFYSLAGRRPDYLRRESALERTPAIYEFPREFRKLRAAAVPFLVELCRPSQLTIGPFLRGFYFCGVRPVVSQEVGPTAAALPVTRKAFQAGSEATQMFRPEDYRGAMPRAELVGSREGVRKVPQWVFLSGFFQDVLLADSVALGTSSSSAKTNILRRWLLGAAAAFCLFLSVCLLFSFAQNRRMEATAIDAAQNTGSSVEALVKLDELRQSLEQLAGFNREGAPLSFHWGLYSGDTLYPHVRTLYLERFRQLLLAPIQQAWVRKLKNPSGGDYQRTYDTLKGYLITTSHPKRSSKQFLTPLLEDQWSELGRPGHDRTALAKRQFDFYSEELRAGNPFSGEPDTDAVKKARAFLSNFGGAERIYQFMLAETNKAEKTVNFNQDVKDSAQEVVNNKDVPGAFTKGGWARMQNAIQNATNYFNGETWVLGEGETGSVVNRANLDQELRKRYLTAFITEWRDFLNRSVVLGYKDVKDAAVKLKAIAGSQSPLLALFHMASQNTAVGNPEVTKAFSALYAVMPTANVDQWIGPTNRDYMDDLTGLQLSLEEIVAQGGTPNEAAVAKTLDLAKSAKLKTRQMAHTFGMDAEGHLDQKMQQLLEDPITHLEKFRPGPPSAAGLCREISVLTNKYPFNPRASAQATLADVNSIFKPKEGALWQFYEANLQKLLVLQGQRYAPASGAPVQVTQRFVDFFNRAANFSKALYPEDSPVPHLTLKIRPAKIEGLEGVTLQINGQTLNFTRAGESKSMTFSWPGTSPELKATTTPPYPWATETGLWALYHFVVNADRSTKMGNIEHFEYDLRTGLGRNQTIVGSVGFDLDMGDFPIFRKEYLSGLSCVAEISK